MQKPKFENPHSRKQFQIDRVAFFSDAVIAIAITLMVLEIKIPPLGNGPIKDIISKYGGPFLLHGAALCICFVVIGNLWIKHHSLYEHIINYNRALIKSNLYFLLTVVLLPISISFMFEEGSPMSLKLFVYFVNIGLCNLTYFFMLWVVFHQKNNFSAFSEKELIEQNKYGTLFMSCVFFMVGLFALASLRWFYMPLLLLPLVRIIMIVREKIKKQKAISEKAAD